MKHGELVAELVELYQHDRRREAHRAAFQSSALVWVTAWPTPTCRASTACACCMVHGGAGGAPSANDRPEAPEGKSGERHHGGWARGRHYVLQHR
jgi:hypothetical protein